MIFRIAKMRLNLVYLKQNLVYPVILSEFFQKAKVLQNYLFFLPCTVFLYNGYQISNSN
jgi:hypothetical protein